MKKKLMSLILVLAMLISAASVASSVTASVPEIDTTFTEDDNVKLDAEFEDPLLELWFDHTTHKVTRSTVESTELYTYTIRMAKNEIEDCQFFLASYMGHENITVEVSDFTGPSSITPEVYYEWYVSMDDNGYVPDPLIPLKKEISIGMNESQGFIVKVKTTPTTPAGNYRASLTVKDADGNEIKKAIIKLVVWNFTLPEKSTIDTAFGLGKYGIYSMSNADGNDDGALYKEYYDFLLENRICAYDLPYEVTDERAVEYLDNPRVNSFLLGGYGTDPSDADIKAKYDVLSQKSEWFDKGYFYYVDEPMNEDALGKIAAAGKKLASLYPGYQLISPYFVNYEFGGKDMISIMEPYINIWCVKEFAWTPQGATGDGIVHMLSDAQIKKDGTYAERMAKQVEGGDKNWVYLCWEPLEPYVTFDAAHQGIEQRIAFWQSYMNDATGLLYFAVNEWNQGFTMWRSMKKINAGGYPVYGDGTLLYCGAMLNRIGEENITGPVGSTRIENIRDGIEDHMYLSIAEDMFGREVADEFVSKITTSVIDWTKDDGVMAATRRALGELIAAEFPLPTPSEFIFGGNTDMQFVGQRKIVPAITPGITVGDFKAALSDSTGTVVYIPNGRAELEDSDIITNGCIARLIDENGILMDEAVLYNIGDANGDGKINAKDVSNVLKVAASWSGIDLDETAADVNGDGTVNLKDVSLYLKKTAGWDVTFVTPKSAEPFNVCGTFVQNTYTDVVGDEHIETPQTLNGSKYALSFPVQYGAWLKEFTIPLSSGHGDSYTIEIAKDGNTVASVTDKLPAGADRQYVVVDLSALVSDHELLRAGHYTVTVTGDDIAVTVRNAATDKAWTFSIDGEKEKDISMEASVTIENSEIVDPVTDVNVSTMVRPMYTTVKIPGLTEDFTFLHITDTHLALMYEDEGHEYSGFTERHQNAESRTWQFTQPTGIAPEDRFPSFLKLAKELDVDRIIATGDIVDFSSEMNVDTAFALGFEETGIPYTYCFGNHDWSFNDCYCTESARRLYADRLFAPFMGEDNYYDEIDMGEFIIVAADNSVDNFTASQVEKFKETNAKGKPIILCVHVPFLSDTLVADTKANWGNRNILIGPGTDIAANGYSLEIYNMIAEGKSNVAAIFCGHLHFNHLDYVGSVPQYCTGDGYEGYCRVVTLTGK